MKRVKTKNATINIPTSWEDIKLETYEKWHFRQLQHPAQNIEYLADLCQIDPKVLISDADLLQQVKSALSFTANTNFPAVSATTIHSMRYSISLADELSFGEWVDVDALMGGEPTNLLSDLLAIVCRPLGETYTHKQAKDRALLFRQQSCAKMMPLVSFFLLKKQKFNETSNLYSKAEQEVNQFLLATKSFAPSGAGTKRLPIWHRIMYYFLTKLLKKQLSKFSDFYSIV